ncbi:MAG: transaldolase family protein [Pseudomonadota bacterium]|jgi:transaldolase
MSSQKNPHILALNELGQSVWYDNLSRDVLRSGQLKELIEQGVSGLTSNPTIFKQAIADTTNYDDDMKSSELKGLSTEALCEELMLRDVAAAADLLRPTYDATSGGDGYASIEVSPYLAADCQATIDAAVRLWGKLNRPNVMIKIPATAECIPAIQAVLEKGINVNVTLIFSKQVYDEVAQAYIRALEARASRGESVRGISSVASFFVSRVDAIVEKSFDELLKAGKVQASDKEVFFGKVGVANSKIAYASFEKLFSSDAFKALKEKGARVQRPLWASTGTKNPVFKAVMYVEELAGRDTVNTMPPATVKALLAGADIKPNLHSGASHAVELIAKVNSMGIPTDSLYVELQKAGVKSFADSYRELLDSIETKRKSI